MTPSNSQLDRLGSRLRASTDIAPDDRSAYVEYRAEFAETLADMQERIAEVLAVRVVSRLKTLETVVLKLKRQHVRLSQIADIAGCRIVVDSLSDQNEAVRRLEELFPECRTIDYREESQWGYRAIHVIVRGSGGRLVEIQVRTNLQNAWANLSEAIAYRLDMSIKYGAGSSEVRGALEELSNAAYQLDQTISDIRALQREVATHRENLTARHLSADDLAADFAALDGLEERIRQFLQDAEGRVHTFEQQVGSLVEVLREIR